MKRLTNTEKWNNKNFRLLSSPAKLFCEWSNDHCDHAGVITPDFETASLQIGESVNENTILEINNRLDGVLREIKPGTYWIQGYIEFQHGKFDPRTPWDKMGNLFRVVAQLIASHGLDFKPNPNLVKYQSEGSENPNLESSDGYIKLNHIKSKGGMGENKERSESQKASWNLKCRCDEVKRLWLIAHKQAFPKQNYKFTGPDSGQLKLFMQDKTVSPEKLILVAKEAWNHNSDASFSWCRSLTSLCFLVTKFNEITSELYGKKTERTGGPGGFGATDRNAGTLNNPNDYAGITEKL